MTTLVHQENFCDKLGTFLSSLYMHLIHCVKLLSKLEANFKHLVAMGLVTDVTFMGLSSVNNDILFM